MFVRLLIIVLNVPAVAATAFSCVFAVWFSRYQQRNVGPSVTYMAYAVISLFLALLTNLVLWIVLRKRKSECRFLRRVTGGVLIFFLVTAWIETRFSYLGERYALTHSLWSAIRMKDPPTFVPSVIEAPVAPDAALPEPSANPCSKGCN